MGEGTTLWIAGRVRWQLQEVPEPMEPRPLAQTAWEPLGIYTSRDDAEKRCAQERDFVAPIPLGVDLPDDSHIWPGMSYPVILRRMRQEREDRGKW